MLTDTAVLILVREGCSLTEIEAYTGLCRERSDALFMRALKELDNEGRRDRHNAACRRWRRKKRLAGPDRGSRVG